MKDFDLRKLQLTEYEMLKDVTKFCDDNGITYFLIFGTLLGAIRNGGFIPWDDDIDICMDVKNYRKFNKLAPKGLPSKYFVQNFRTEEKCYFQWTKIRINNTTSIDPRLKGLGIHFGICMDVFVINGFSDNNFHRKLQIKMTKLQNDLLYKYYYLNGNFKIKTRKKYFCYKILPELVRRFFIRLLDYLILIDLSKCEFCYNNFYRYLNNCCKYKTNWFKETERVKYENDYFLIPQKYEDILSSTYGDWRTPPPETERSGHGNIIVDFDKDYSYYCSKI